MNAFPAAPPNCPPNAAPAGPPKIPPTPAPAIGKNPDNKPIFKENIDKGRALKDTGQHLDILEDLNDKIPEGASRLLINKDGNINATALRFKAVPKEVERFAKTINDFLSSAKDMFGARVTNYDVSQFKSRLPNLLNSKEGRREIIQQMKILNKIEQNYRNSLKSVYQHYGMDNIPQEEAERLAEKISRNEEEALRDQLMGIGKEDFSLEELPNPADHAGKIIEDDQGRRYRSNGSGWEAI